MEKSGVLIKSHCFQLSPLGTQKPGPALEEGSCRNGECSCVHILWPLWCGHTHLLFHSLEGRSPTCLFGGSFSSFYRHPFLCLPGQPWPVDSCCIPLSLCSWERVCFSRCPCDIGPTWHSRTLSPSWDDQLNPVCQVPLPMLAWGWGRGRPGAALLPA